MIFKISPESLQDTFEKIKKLYQPLNWPLEAPLNGFSGNIFKLSIDSSILEKIELMQSNALLH